VRSIPRTHYRELDADHYEGADFPADIRSFAQLEAPFTTAFVQTCPDFVCTDVRSHCGCRVTAPNLVVVDSVQDLKFLAGILNAARTAILTMVTVVLMVTGVLRYRDTGTAREHRAQAAQCQCSC
jgi:hypothetical protein